MIDDMVSKCIFVSKLGIQINIDFLGFLFTVYYTTFLKKILIFYFLFLTSIFLNYQRAVAGTPVDETKLSSAKAM